MNLITSDPTAELSATLRAALDGLAAWSECGAFYFEYANCMTMFAPAIGFLDIPEAPLPSLGGTISGLHIAAALMPANDRFLVSPENSLS